MVLFHRQCQVFCRQSIRDGICQICLHFLLFAVDPASELSRGDYTSLLRTKVKKGVIKAGLKVHRERDHLQPWSRLSWVSRIELLDIQELSSCMVSKHISQDDLRNK